VVMFGFVSGTAFFVAPSSLLWVLESGPVGSCSVCGSFFVPAFSLGN
jgi:hypothetical protein